MKYGFGVDLGGTTVKIAYFDETGNMLDKWEIPYDEILYGKPWPGHKGFYVDDRTVRPDEFLKYNVDELNEICRNSKCNEE